VKPDNVVAGATSRRGEPGAAKTGLSEYSLAVRKLAQPTISLELCYDVDMSDVSLPTDPQSTTPPVSTTPSSTSDGANGVPTPPNAVLPHSPFGRRKDVLSTPIPGETVTSTSEQPTANTETAQPEQASNQPAEYENSQVELEPTIEKLQAEVEQHKMKAPENVVVRQDTPQQPLPKTVAQPIIILPLTEESMKKGKKKSPTESIRWLVAWANRQLRLFKNILVVYRKSSYNKPK
jgi:hypothetical protein